MDIWSYIGLIMVFYVGYKFIKQLGTGLPILELMMLIAGLQWIVGAVIEYANPSMHYRYYMYVDQAEYMQFVVPAYSVFCIIIFLLLKKINRIEVPINDLKYYSQYGLRIFLIGVFFDLTGSLFPGPLGFFAYILANFKYVGAIVLFFSENKKLKNIFYGVIAFLLLTSIVKAFFHDFILWSVFFYLFYAFKTKPSFLKIAGTFIVGGFFLLTLQTVKSAFRNEVWNNYSGNKVELFVSLVSDAIFPDEMGAEEFDDEVGNNVRLNQGWIISAIIDNIPRNQDYLHGETIVDAVFSSLLPRFLNPNKAKAGGRENFRDFTGLELSSGTSMGISIIGEAYGNFAVFGGIMFMGVWGLFLGKFWVFLYRKVEGNIVFIAFLPLLFLQVIKAETELLVVLNHLIKSSIVVLAFIWFVKKRLNWNLEK